MAQQFTRWAPRCRRRRRPTPRDPEPWERELLRLVAGLFAVRVDQLGRLLGTGEEETVRLVRRLARAGFVDTGPVLCGEPDWLWLTTAGNRLSGLEFIRWRPRLGAIERIRAVNEIRIHVAEREPQARWVSSRAVARRQGKRGHRLHGLVEIGGERHAVLVLNRVVDPESWLPILETAMARHDAAIVFANPAPRRQVERLAAKNHWPKLIVRRLPPVDAPADWARGAKATPDPSMGHGGSKRGLERR